MKWIWILIVLLSQWTVANEKLPKNLIQNLSSRDFETRSQAVTKLTQWAKENSSVALRELPLLLKNEPHPETSARIMAVLQVAYLGQGKGFLGVGFSIKSALEFENKKIDGLFLTDVTPGAAADKAGLKRKDIIIALDGHPFPLGTQRMDVIRRVGTLEPDKKYKVTILRDQKKLRISIRPGKRPDRLNNEALKQEEFRNWLADRLQ